LLLTFSLTLFVSALLLFLVQPMFGKMVLPLLGGSPAVWNTCMVFYQAALLGGYAYAHAAPRWLGLKRQALLHLGLLLLGALALPIGIARGWTPPASSSPIPWLLLVLTASVGLPFFVVSATAPLLQRWFSHTGHAAARDPYFLYGASNLGSMTALLSYPFLVEAHLRLAEQARVWALGYVLLVGLIAGCAVLLWRAPAAPPAAAGPEAAPPGAGEEPLTWGRRVWWVLLAFAPSSLLLGVTAYLSTDIAAVPLLWVIPLAIYLLTFVLVFARSPLLPQSFMVLAEPFLVIPLALLFFLNLKGAWPLFPLHLLAFFVMAMVCHGELMRYRPGAAHLTEFYLWMSVGGVLGGLFNALVAPATFKGVVEYPLMIMVASLLRPQPGARPGRAGAWLLDLLLPLVLALALGGLCRAVLAGDFSWQMPAIVALSCLAGAFAYSFRHRPVRFGLGVGAVMAAAVLLPPGASRVLLQERNFFGVLQVRHDAAGNYHLLYHGTTLHGAQSLEPSRRREPLTYYHPAGPLGQVFQVLSGNLAPRRMAVVGLGTGSIASYGKAGQTLTFYEIDPAVERLARDPRYFTFLQDCPAQVEVVLGDARLSLKEAPDFSYDLMVLDAFSSDAIPLHLVTREALALYLAKLRPGGMLAFHISNRYLDLEPVLGGLARDAGLACLIRDDKNLGEAEKQARKSPSTWAVMGQGAEGLSRLAADPRWHPAAGRPGLLWTDDFSNILEVFKWESLKLEAPGLSPDAPPGTPVIRGSG
jgi:hypothetical protein